MVVVTGNGNLTMMKYNLDNLPSEAHIQMLAKEATELEWVNRALKFQIMTNENRLTEIEKELEKYVREQKNEQCKQRYNSNLERR